MRKLLIAAIAWNGLLSAAHADEAAEILARAVKASAGSEEALAKRRYCLLKQSGVIFLPTGASPATRSAALALPDRGKWALEMKPATGPMTVTVVLNGLRGWSKTSNGVADLPPSQYDSVQNEAYTYWLANLVPLTSKSIKWELLKDATVDGKPCRVLKATQGSRPAVMLYCDRDSALVLKAAYSGTESFQQTTKEYLFSAHREFEGQRLPGKVTVMQAGKRIEEWTNESIRFPSSIDDKEFAKPQ
jgi:hypothetical protein